jgi:hypothetical protein
MPVISALGKLKQEDHKCEAGLGYKIRPCLKKEKKWLTPVILASQESGDQED